MNQTIKTILIALCVLITCNAYAASFSADAVHMRSTESSHARMFWKDGSVRFEYLEQGIPMVRIFDNVNKKVILLNTKDRVYIQRDLTDQQAMPVTARKAEKNNPCDEFPEAECTRLKSADINGRQTDKWLLTFNAKGRDQHVFQWIDKKHHILVRQENPDGSALDVKIVEGEEINGRNVHKAEMLAIAPDGSSARGVKWYDTELNIVVRQQAYDGAVDELRNIRQEEIQTEMFAVPEGYRTIDSQLSDLKAKTTMSFGTKDK